jgi:flavin-binding protein dodecin
VALEPLNAHTIVAPLLAQKSERAGRRDSPNAHKQEVTVAKGKKAEPVYRVIDVIGTSAVSWEDAAKHAVETAGASLRDLRVAEIAKLDVRIEDGKVVAYRARVQLSFKYEPS